MAAGLGLLGHSPQTFWSMTPRELEAAIRGRLGLDATVTALGRNELQQLMQQFPDRACANE
jgi:uncharacterized phage protein (TIGR02216 family)